MLLIAILTALILNSIQSKQLTYNLNYNGPFNTNKQPFRRKLIDDTLSEDVLFYHGVASGDPSDTDLVIWTRITPPYQDKYALDIDTFNITTLNDLKTKYATILVHYAISTSQDSINFECSDGSCGVVETSNDIDYTVKVITNNLIPNTIYYYQFKVGNQKSQIGRTRTLPTPEQSVNNIRFAFGSCKQWAHGFFNNLRDIAIKNDLDYMLWLGDYIYEFPNTGLVNGSSMDRIPFPDNYLYNLSHYRGRYLQHHLDEYVQTIHKQLAWIMLWDDHEVVNDYWFDGAPEKWQDDSLYGVTFMKRKVNAYRAFFEWNPVRTIDTTDRGGLYNLYRFGNLFDLIVIDAQSQRTKPAENMTYAETLSPDVHYSFGQTQRNWIINQLSESQLRGTKWRLLGTDNAFGQSPPKEVFNGKLFFGEDKLEGYTQERQMILDAINNNNIKNVISMAGGPHTGIAQSIFSTGKPIKNNLDSYPLFVEFVADAVSAPKLFEDDNYVPYMDNFVSEWSWVAPYFKLQVDGYCILDVNKERVKVEFWINNNTKDVNTKSVLDKTFCVYDDTVELIECVTGSTSSSPIEESENRGAIIGGVIGGLFLIMIIGICVVVFCNRRRHKYTKMGNESTSAVHVPSSTVLDPDTV
eukprot:317469_1